MTDFSPGTMGPADNGTTFFKASNMFSSWLLWPRGPFSLPMFLGVFGLPPVSVGVPCPALGTFPPPFLPAQGPLPHSSYIVKNPKHRCLIPFGPGWEHGSHVCSGYPLPPPNSFTSQTWPSSRLPTLRNDLSAAQLLLVCTCAII